MSLAQKLILFALAVALLPMAGTGLGLVRVGEAALRRASVDEQLAVATAVAGQVAQAVEELRDRLSTVMEIVDVRGLSAAEREGLLRLLYRQSADASAAVLLSAAGESLAPPVYLAPGEAAGTDLAAHPALHPEELAAFLAALPRQLGAAGRALVSPAYFGKAGEARVAVSVPCCADAAGAATARAGIEIVLRRAALRVAGLGDVGARTFVVDQAGQTILHPDASAGTDFSAHGAVSAYLRERQVTSEYLAAGEAWLGAVAPVGGLGWSVIVERPGRVAFAAAIQMRRQTLAWLVGTAVVVIIAALLFAGSLQRVLARLMAGARAYAARRFGERIAVGRRDEMGELAGTMNTMAEELERSLRELDDWSKSLELKVEQRTQELKDAQAQLLMQSKLAAIGQLGAGVAHEVNNPLAGILGYAQLLLRKHPEGDPEHESLKRIEEAAKRCKEITLSLLRFSERGLAGRQRISLNDVARQVLEVVEGALREAKIDVVRELAAELPTGTADPGQLAIVLMNLLTNAKTAMPQGGTLRVRTEIAGPAEVRLVVADTGVGIDPAHRERIFEPFFTTKKLWTAAGLGLSVAYRIVSDHGGRIEVKSAVGAGATFTITLPLAPPEPAPAPALPRPTLLA